MAALRSYVVAGLPGGAVAVADRFTRAGFLLGPLWLAWHGLWPALALWVIATGTVASLFLRFGADDTALAVLWLTAAALIGWEGPLWRIEALAAQGFAGRLVLAGSADEALLRAARGQP